MAGPELYNSKIIDAFVKFIKSKYSYVNISELLEYAGMEIYQIDDPTHWFTQEQVDLFYDRARQLTGNENLARDAGRYNISPEAVGTIRNTCLVLLIQQNPSKYSARCHLISRDQPSMKVNA